MSAPIPYAITTSFAQDVANNVAGRSTVRPDRLDAELQNIVISLNATITNLNLIQRSDGALANNIVTIASLNSTVVSLFGQNLKARGLWLTATAYAVNDVVETGNPAASYVCLIAHTSGTFATDKTNGDWMLFGATAGSVLVVTTLTVSGVTTSGSVVTALIGTTTAANFVIQTNSVQGWAQNVAAAPTWYPIADNTQNVGAVTNRIAVVFASAIDSGVTGSLSVKVNNGETVATFNRNGGVTVNAFEFLGSPTLVALLLRPTGTDANVTLQLSAKGNSALDLYTEGGAVRQVSVLDTPGANRSLTLTGSNGGNPTIGVTAGNLTITPTLVLTAGLIFSTALTQIIPGATSFSIRNNANSFDNLTILDNGNATVRGTLTVTGGITGTAGLLSAGTTCSQSPAALSTKTTQAHGLGAAPFMVISYIECLTAELGYSIGDRVFPGHGTSGSGWMVEWDATNVNILTDNTNVAVINKTTPAGLVAVTLANWKIVAVPYKLS